MNINEIKQSLVDQSSLSYEYQDRYYLKKHIQSFYPDLNEKTIYNIIEKSFINSKGEKKLLIKELVRRITGK